MTIKAIETRYKSYRFRSRLEARWAVFFDALGIRYKYEEYGFESNGYSWLPDFYLPDTGTWVEVKGGIPSQDDATKMGSILDYGSPLPFFSGSWMDRKIICDEFYEMGGNPSLQSWRKLCPGVLLLGEIPNIKHGIVVHTLMTHHKGLVRTGAAFYPNQTVGAALEPLDSSSLKTLQLFHDDIINLSGSDEFFESLDGFGVSPSDFEPSTFAIESKRAHRKICEAYQKARAARFEHGEQG